MRAGAYRAHRRDASVTGNQLGKRHPLQRCQHFVPGLRSRPWWPPAELDAAGILESVAEAVATEFEELVLSERLRLHPQSSGGIRKELASGDWNIFELYTSGRPHLGNLVEVPVTAGLLAHLGGAIGNPRGLVYFSVLQPGVHVRSHCGPTNTRLRLHLGLRTQPGATIRVGTESRSWEHGRCLVFDDSWEHEAENPTDRPRAVLIVDIWHPDLTEKERVRLGNPGTAAAANPPATRGWIREGANGETIGATQARLDPIDPAVFMVIDPARLSRIRALTDELTEIDIPFLRAAARHLQSALPSGQGTASDAEATILARTATHMAFHEFGRLNGRFPESDIVEILLMCGLAWRSCGERRDTEAAFLERWPPAPKASLAERLVAAGELPAMFDLLEGQARLGAAAPFGALIPVIAAAHRRVAAPQQRIT